MKISVVCPFYNEENIIEKAVLIMLGELSKLPYEWELIVVNDGSIDNGPSIVERIALKHVRLVPVGYNINRGRGYALMTGIKAATGDIIVTTEIDCSWGVNIVARLVERLVSNSKTDFVIASPNLRGGGYRNVPIKRVLLSKIGNRIIRAFLNNSITMNTGMTRAYRRNIIYGLDFDEHGKEFHLEVLLKLLALGYKAEEIPVVLEWKDEKLAKAGTPVRKSSSHIGKLILTHLHFAVFSNPIRYFWLLSFICAITGFGLEGFAVVRLIRKEVAIYLALVGLLLLLFSLIFFAFGVVTAQNRYIMKELWKRHRGN
jgi:glycosyltransferase involved in cell wall biosynthesis